MFIYTVLICLPMLAFCQQQNFLAHQEFRRFDVDRDGNIEPGEIQNYFDTYDRDGDGRISRDEYRREVDAHHINNPQAHQALLRLFDDLDTDNDNHLERGDYNRIFRDADTNNNGLVSEQEFVDEFHRLTGGPILG